ncbi:MAG: DUF2804 domain-containing protein [Candidatus Hodarchaeota archaeon]
MKEQITEPGDLHDENGHLLQKGWAWKLILKHKRENIKVSSLKIKDWDCYIIYNENYSIGLIIADVGYFGMATFDWIDFKAKENSNGIGLKLFTRGSLNMPPSSEEGDVNFEKGELYMRFVRKGDERILSFQNNDFMKKKGIKGEITLYQDPNMDTCVDVVPFKNPKQFVYAQKINCMVPTGTVQIGDETFKFMKENGSVAVIDWSRGVFPYKTHWYWGSASTMDFNGTGKMFGFNLDYGFGLKEYEQKNFILYDGKGHKFDKIEYKFDSKDLTKPWEFTSGDGRFEMTLDPVFDTEIYLNMLFLKTGGQKVWGYFSGDVVLDDGEKLHVDKLFGFAENYSHRW